MALFKLTKQDRDYYALQDLLKPKEEQQEETAGIGTKPGKQEQDEEGMFTSFFRGLFDRSEKRAQEIAKEAKESALAARLTRELSGITKSLTEEDVAVRSASRDPRYGNQMPEETTLVDVTDTDMGKLTNVKPLYDLAEAVDPGTIDTSELPGKGLMSPRLDGKDGDLAESYDAMEMDAYLDEFIPEMAQLEGMGGDVVLGDLEPTYSYGITEQKANEYNMRPSQFETMEEFARAFAARYRQEKEDMYPDIFTSDLDKEVERGLQSYLWNRGSFYPGQLAALREGNLNGFINELKDVISASDREAPNNQSRPMSGLSKRRAAEANLVGRGIEGYVPITTVETTGTQQRPIFIWRDIQGNELNRFAPQKQLHSQSTMGDLEVPQ
jgi:hypothetical protein